MIVSARPSRQPTQLGFGFSALTSHPLRSSKSNYANPLRREMVQKAFLVGLKSPSLPC